MATNTTQSGAKTFHPAVPSTGKHIQYNEETQEHGFYYNGCHLGSRSTLAEAREALNERVYDLERSGALYTEPASDADADAAREAAEDAEAAFLASHGLDDSLESLIYGQFFETSCFIGGGGSFAVQQGETPSTLKSAFFARPATTALFLFFHKPEVEALMQQVARATLIEHGMPADLFDKLEAAFAVPRAYVPQLHEDRRKQADELVHAAQQDGRSKAVDDIPAWKAGMKLIMDRDPQVQCIGWDFLLEALGIDPEQVNVR